MVSIIIPAYNAEKYIKDCLISIQNQNYPNLEIIIVDDGSIDGTYDACQMQAAEDDRIILVKQENSGVSAARNRGLSLARGRYVCFVDADDSLPEGAIQTMVENFDEGCDLVVGSYSVYRRLKHNDIGLAERRWNDSDIKENFGEFDKLINTPWAKLYLTQIINEHHVRFDESLPLGEDHKFNLTYCQYVSCVKVIADTVYNYRLGGVASSLKYYPNKAFLNFSLLDSYQSFFGSWERIPKDFIKKKVKDQLFGCVEHYIVHCSIRNAMHNTEALFDVFSEYLTKEMMDCEIYSESEVAAILQRKSRKVMFLVYKRKVLRLTAKKIRTCANKLKIRMRKNEGWNNQSVR